MMIIRDFTERCRSGLAKLGLTLANPEDIAEGRALAARTVSPNIATVETLLRVQRHTGSSSFTLRSVNGELAGVLAVIPLTPMARPTLAAGILDGVDPPDDLIARPADPVAAIYGWGMAGATWRGRATVLAAALKIHRELFPDLPLYGRAATPGGERALLSRIGARPVPGPGGLVMAPAWNLMKAAA